MTYVRTLASCNSIPKGSIPNNPEKDHRSIDRFQSIDPKEQIAKYSQSCSNSSTGSLIDAGTPRRFRLVNDCCG
jgi:hypothetical protein